VKEKSHKCGKFSPSSTYAYVRVVKGDTRRARASSKRRVRAAIAQVIEYLR
jgi:hypothetical protein